MKAPEPNRHGPAWLRGVALANPLTYQVDALRTFMLLGAASAFGVGIDFGVQLAVLALLVATASRLYPGIIT